MDRRRVDVVRERSHLRLVERPEGGVVVHPPAPEPVRGGWNVDPLPPVPVTWWARVVRWVREW